jgi:hypothetical protein
MKTAWHQQYHSLIKKGIKNPDPHQQFMINLGKFLSQLRDDGSEYILGWDASTATTTTTSKTSYRTMTWSMPSPTSWMHDPLHTPLDPNKST